MHPLGQRGDQPYEPPATGEHDHPWKRLRTRLLRHRIEPAQPRHEHLGIAAPIRMMGTDEFPAAPLSPVIHPPRPPSPALAQNQPKGTPPPNGPLRPKATVSADRHRVAAGPEKVIGESRRSHGSGSHPRDQDGSKPGDEERNGSRHP